MIFREARMEHYVHIAVDGARQARFAGAERCRSACDRLRIQHTVANDAQTAGALGHQHAAVRKKGRAEGVFERPGNDDNPNALALGRVELHRLVRELLAREPLGRHWDAIFKWDLLLAECGHGRKYDSDRKAFHSSTLFHFVERPARLPIGIAKIRSSLPKV